MKCQKCNSEVKDGLKFCPKCGSEIPKIHFCSKCGAELKDGLRFCPKCGSAIEDSNRGDAVFNNSSPKSSVITCPICNHPLTIDNSICPNCHRYLYYKCTKCNNNFTYGELIKNHGNCPQCGANITSLHNIPNEKYPYAVKMNNYLDDNIQIQEGQSNARKWLKGAAIIFTCYFGLSLIANMCSGIDNSTHYEAGVEPIHENSNIIGKCKYCGDEITINSPHECSNVCSKPSCKEQYERYMLRNTYEHVNGKGSYDKAINQIQKKFSNY